ncbi:major facilitator superfamily domain-containing protein [Phaeosphaeria sp. MPI-PUGE-AT-0046c]|nr:major facilitator superfamily domain-containing protein [Phaeosphaeria sp. MPI-PUGE-AT-0046c]
MEDVSTQPYGATPLKQVGEKTVESAMSDHNTETVSWTVAEEKKAVRKLDFYLMPLLVLGFFVLQLDRSNIGNALTDTITKDLGITTDDVNLGNQLMLAGIVISELPSNMLLQKVGAPIWLTGQMGIWGTIALVQAWVTNRSSFFATRFLLGVFEGGYVPGSQYMLSLFYTREELALRTAIFYFGNYFATATGSLMAAGILQLAGQNGLSGWQWLFIIEGIMTLVVFVVFIALLPKSTVHTKPIHGYFDYFTTKDRTILSSRMSALQRSAKADLNWASLKGAFLDIRLWLHMILNMASLAPKGGLQLYGPSVIKGLGFSKTRANALNSISSYLVVVFSFLISYASDKTHLRGPWCIVAFAWSIAFAGALYGLPLKANRWARFWVFTFLGSGNALAQGLNDAWLSANAQNPASRSIGLALVVMGSNLGGLAGQQMFRSSDAPRYQRGFLAILCLYVASIVITVVIMGTYWWSNKKARAEHEVGQRVEDGEEEVPEGPFKCQL